MDRLDVKRAQIAAALAALHDRPHDGEFVAGRVMTADPVCITAQASVLDLVRMFHAKAFRHLLVADDAGRLLGVISDRDVLRCLGPDTADPAQLTRIAAGDLMSTDLVTISRNTPVAQAIGLMVDQGISCLPVLEGQRPVGIMTSTDLHVLLQVLLQTARVTGAEKSAAAVSG
jgi:acetoin utilization protein AcuB